ncbi:hypothetical protein GTY82_06300 [Streptomyces sp. SID5476]|uniref:Uncharacterized protein n=1 Tax=Streptomyces bottropensis ATCC 25435 TaxID=1054862 RepID=M3FVY5_9ACTN|nr:hypothetical protein [Streptomyces bottropensis]EMF56384.1 hypothetical protein SBD_2294 [Streptomyces bottropensis ATCC 25435]MZD16860.1 hypothetical protein [Streptomyces sp. SID5476]
MASSFCAAAGQSGLDGGDLAEPALILRLLEVVDEVGVDLLEPWHLGLLLLAGAGGPSAGDERLVGLDRLGRVDR